MGVGDYVHSKETRQHQPQAREAHPQSRHALAEQARVEVPTTNLVAPVPISTNRQAPLDRYGTPFQGSTGQNGKPIHRDMFDTDVEGIDDSTIAATSVIGIDEIPYRFSPAPTTTTTVQPQEPAPEPPHPLHQLRQLRRPPDPKWYQGLGDKALKTAGFDSEDADDASQLTSTAGDDELSNDTDDQRFAPRYRTSEEPLSRRLQTFWSASRRSYPKSGDNTQVEPSKIPTASNPKALPVGSSSSRKVTLHRSMTTTPRTRFSPPKPSLLDQLDLTPTRRSSGTRTQPEKDLANHAGGELQDARDGLGLFSVGDRERSASLQSLSAFDITNLDDLDDDPVNDPFSRRASVVRRPAPEPTLSKKRNLDLDYPPEILYKKSFAELQAEPFDYTPAATPPIPTTSSKPDAENQTAPEKGEDEDKISFLLRLSEEGRRAHFAKLPMDEWEDYGDLLIDQFSQMLSKMKHLRQARRRTAAVFEAEIKRRHELVEDQSVEISEKFEEMRAGGVEVLRGRTP